MERSRIACSLEDFIATPVRCWSRRAAHTNGGALPTTKNRSSQGGEWCRVAFANAIKKPGWLAGLNSLQQQNYFLRETRPVTSEPSPRSPNKGNGEAVCGSFPPLAGAALPAPAFWSLELLGVEAAL